jgi:hypothetical protein
MSFFDARVLGLAVLLCGCGADRPPVAACDFPGTRPMLRAELFFGRGDPAHPAVTDHDWTAFAADTLTPNFPDGLTQLDAAGQWRAGPGVPIEREASKAVIVVLDDTVASRAHLAAVTAEYRRRFHQTSVGLTLDRTCAAF